MMTIIIDADGCPVRDIAVKAAKNNGLKAIIVSDINHIIEDHYAEVITVDKGIDSADFRIMSLLKAGDLVITQDYGLASLVLAKKGYAIDQNGMLFTDDNIEMLLLRRHISKNVRRSGGKTKGPAKRKKEDDLFFKSALDKMISKYNK